MSLSPINQTNLFSLDNYLLEFVELYKKKKLPVLIYTVNTLEDLYKVKRLEVDGVFTDDPKKIYAFLKKI